MLEADEAYFKEKGEPLFSSHMLDLSEESKEENIETCVKYFERMAKINLFLEMEIGITGGEEDGVDNTSVDNSALYTQPEDILDIHKHAHEQLKTKNPLPLFLVFHGGSGSTKEEIKTAVENGVVKMNGELSARPPLACLTFPSSSF